MFYAAENVETAIAETARAAEIEVTRYSSARHPRHDTMAILSCRAFAAGEPAAHQTWQLLFGNNGARAVCVWPRRAIDFSRNAFRPDLRIAALNWER